MVLLRLIRPAVALGIVGALALGGCGSKKSPSGGSSGSGMTATTAVMSEPTGPLGSIPDTVNSVRGDTTVPAGAENNMPDNT